MQREIKFRAWDGEQMWLQGSDFGFEFGGGCEAIRIYSSDGEIDIVGAEDMKFMQYIDIKDKNGVDVYEGDVLFAAIKGGFTYTGPVKFFEEFGIFGIAMVEKFKYNAANPDLPLGSSGSSTNYKPYNWKSYRSIEVIGNIYDKGNR